MRTWRQYLLFGGAALLLSCSKGALPPDDKTSTSSTSASPGAPPPSTPAVKSNKWALLVGINNYKYPNTVSTLAGSVNDVEGMRSLLVGKYEFPPESVMVLKDKQASHAAIIDAIQKHLIKNAKPNDIVVFHFSGHGSQMPDVTSQKISDLDETIVPWDSRDPKGEVFDISGAELHGLLLQLAAITKNVTFVLDSCHSGTLVRGRGGRVRGIEADTRKPPEKPPSYAVTTRNLGSTDPGPKLQYASIAGATSRESAFEHFADGKEHGALTYFLVRELRNAGKAATYRDVMDKVAGLVNANYPTQHPQLEGVGSDQLIFGDSSSLSRNFVLVSSVENSRVSLAAGQVNGVTVGSVYDIYKPGTKQFAPPETPIAKVSISSVSDYASEARVISGSGIAQFSRAIETERQYGSSKLRIYFDGLDASPRLKQLRDVLAAQSYVEVVNDAESCHVQIREVNGKILTLGADATTLSTPVDSNSQNMTDRVRGQIEGWAKWFSVLSIDNSQSDVAIELSIKASQTRDPFARVGTPDMGVFDGEDLDISLKNVSARDLYVTVLDLSTDGSISVLYPDVGGTSEVLKPGAILTRKVTAQVPQGRSIVTDILTAVASTKPIDLRSSTSAAIRSTEFNPIQDLFSAANGTQRALVPAGAKPVPLTGWTTARRVVLIKRKK